VSGLFQLERGKKGDTKTPGGLESPLEASPQEGKGAKNETIVAAAVFPSLKMARNRQVSFFLGSTAEKNT